MYRIADLLLDGSIAVDVEGNTPHIDFTVPLSRELTDEEIVAIKNASLIEEVETNYGEVGNVVSSYNISGWISVRKGWNGTCFTWNTCRLSDLEDLTQAVLELAEIVGGNNG